MHSLLGLDSEKAFISKYLRWRNNVWMLRLNHMYSDSEQSRPGDSLHPRFLKCHISMLADCSSSGMTSCAVARASLLHLWTFTQQKAHLLCSSHSAPHMHATFRTQNVPESQRHPYFACIWKMTSFICTQDNRKVEEIRLRQKMWCQKVWHHIYMQCNNSVTPHLHAAGQWFDFFSTLHHIFETMRLVICKVFLERIERTSTFHFLHAQNLSAQKHSFFSAFVSLAVRL